MLKMGITKRPEAKSGTNKNGREEDDSSSSHSMMEIEDSSIEDSSNQQRLDVFFARQSRDQIKERTLEEICIEESELSRLTLYNNRINATLHSTDADCVFSPYRSTTGRLVYGTNGITTIYHPTEGYFIHLISNWHEDPLPLEETLTVAEWLKHRFRTSLVSWDLYLETAIVHDYISPSNHTACSAVDADMHLCSFNYNYEHVRPRPEVDGYSGIMCAYETFKKCLYQHHVPGVSNRAACSNVRAHAVDARYRAFADGTVDVQGMESYDVIRDLVECRRRIDIFLSEDESFNIGDLDATLQYTLRLFGNKTASELAVLMLTSEPLIRRQMTRSDYGSDFFSYIYKNKKKFENKIEQLAYVIIDEIPKILLTLSECRETLEDGELDICPDRAIMVPVLKQKAESLVGKIMNWINVMRPLLFEERHKVMDLYAASRILRRSFGCETRSMTRPRLTGHPRLPRNIVYYAGQNHIDVFLSFCLDNGFHIHSKRNPVSNVKSIPPQIYKDKDLSQKDIMLKLAATHSVEIDRLFDFDPPVDIYNAQFEDIQRVYIKARAQGGRGRVPL